MAPSDKLKILWGELALYFTEKPYTLVGIPSNIETAYSGAGCSYNYAKCSCAHCTPVYI